MFGEIFLHHLITLYLCSYSVFTSSQCSSVKVRLCVARDAWSSLGNMTKEEAMKNYVEDIQLVSPFREKLKPNRSSIQNNKQLVNLERTLFMLCETFIKQKQNLLTAKTAFANVIHFSPHCLHVALSSSIYLLFLINFN